MSATLVERGQDTVVIRIEVRLGRSMLQTEQDIQQALNQAGLLASAEALRQFDTDGSAIEVGPQRLTSKGQEPKTYQTPYGEATVERHVYQTSQGGATFCPLEREARIIISATPLFAKQVSSKYADAPGARVVADLHNNHGRKVALATVQDLAAAVAAVAQAKEESWHYQPPKLPQPVATIAAGLDGTCMLLVEDGSRQAMVGTVSLYDKDGERLHTIYVAATPQYGKANFHQRLAREIERAQQRYPQAKLTGVADGSEDNWTFLRQYSEDECLDYWHAAGYLDLAAKAIHRPIMARLAWVEQARYRLRDEVGAAEALLEEMRGVDRTWLSGVVLEDLDKAIGYFAGHTEQMNYAQRRAEGLPIGSGVTEAACKTLVKMRLCRAGAKWKEEGAAAVLSLRVLLYTAERWEQFWAKVDQYGFPIAA